MPAASVQQASWLRRGGGGGRRRQRLLQDDRQVRAQHRDRRRLEQQPLVPQAEAGQQLAQVLRVRRQAEPYRARPAHALPDVVVVVGATRRQRAQAPQEARREPRAVPPDRPRRGVPVREAKVARARLPRRVAATGHDVRRLLRGAAAVRDELRARHARLAIIPKEDRPGDARRGARVAVGGARADEPQLRREAAVQGVVRHVLAPRRRRRARAAAHVARAVAHAQRRVPARGAVGARGAPLARAGRGVEGHERAPKVVDGARPVARDRVPEGARDAGEVPDAHVGDRLRVGEVDPRPSRRDGRAQHAVVPRVAQRQAVVRVHGDPRAAERDPQPRRRRLDVVGRGARRAPGRVPGLVARRHVPERAHRAAHVVEERARQAQGDARLVGRVEAPVAVVRAVAPRGRVARVDERPRRRHAPRHRRARPAHILRTRVSGPAKKRWR